jgi:hypothetical protein
MRLATLRRRHAHKDNHDHEYVKDNQGRCWQSTAVMAGCDAVGA